MKAVNYTPAFQQAAAFVGRRQPHLAGFFHDAAAVYSDHAPLAEPALNALAQLTSASEFLFIDPQRLIPLALRRAELPLLAETLYRLAACGHRYAAVLLQHYPALGAPLARVAPPLVELANACRGRVAKGERVLQFCLDLPDRERGAFLARHLATVAAASPGTVADVVALLAERLAGYLETPAVAPRALGATHPRPRPRPRAAPDEWQRVAAWIEAGVALFRQGRIDEGIGFFRGSTAESRRLLGLGHSVLAELREVLRIYAGSLCGRDLAVSSLDAGPFGFAEPYTDGTTLFLPRELSLFADQDSNRAVYSLAAANLAGMLALGTFALDLEQAPFMDELRELYSTRLPPIRDTVWRQFRAIGQRVSNRRDGELEVVLAGKRRLLVLNTEHERLFYSFPLPVLARALFIAVESYRIERQLCARYAGLGPDYASVKRVLWQGRRRLELEADDPDRGYGVLSDAVLGLLAGPEAASAPVPEAAAFAEQALAAVSAAGATVADSAYATFRIYRRFDERFNLVRLSLHHDLAAPIVSVLLAGMYPEAVLHATPALLKSEADRPPATVADLELDEPEAAAIDLASLGTQERDRSFLQDVAAGGLRLFRYPEFNVYRGTYLSNHCTLIERRVRPAAGNGEQAYRQLVRQHQAVAQRLKKRFLFMKPEELEVSRRWLSGDDIFLTDAVDFAIDLRRGATPNDKIYTKKVIDRRDIVTAVLVDASSSTGEELHGRATASGGRAAQPPARGLRILDVEQAALSIAAAAMDEIGDAFGIFSFFSLGRSRVFFNVIKDFDERWDERAQSRIGGLEAYASNRDGCAIRHATARLAAREERTKLLLLLSDGIPADLDYGSASSADTSLYAIEDTRRALIEARLRGIVPFCLTVDRFARDYIPRLYGDRQFAMLADVTRLPEKLSQLYLRLTR